MPFCVSCGVRVADGEQYCAGCEAKFNPKPACLQCGTPYSSPEAKFCMVCGTSRVVAPSPSAPQPPPAARPVQPPPSRPAPSTGPVPLPQSVLRPEPNPEPSPPSIPRTAAAGSDLVCPKCGKTIKLSKAKFCIYCAAPLPAEMVRAQPAAAPPVDPVLPPQAAATAPASAAASLTPEQKTEIESVTESRLGLYQKIGRQFLSVCHQGTLPKDQLPAELALEINRATMAIQNGHTRLVRAGICPRCQDTALNARTGRCPKCGLTVTT